MSVSAREKRGYATNIEMAIQFAPFGKFNIGI